MIKVLVFDNLGAGYSSSPKPPYIIAKMADDILFLANEVGFSKFHIVGVSIGGIIAQHVALAALNVC